MVVHDRIPLPVQQKRLKQSEVEALAERLSKSRPLPPPEKRTRAVRLTYTHDKKSKKYLPKLVPAKTVCHVAVQSSEKSLAWTLEASVSQHACSLVNLPNMRKKLTTSMRKTATGTQPYDAHFGLSILMTEQ